MNLNNGAELLGLCGHLLYMELIEENEKKNSEQNHETSKRTRGSDEKTKQLGYSLSQPEPLDKQLSFQKKIKADPLSPRSFQKVLGEQAEIEDKNKSQRENRKREREKKAYEIGQSEMQASSLSKQSAVQKKSKASRLPSELQQFTQEKLKITKAMQKLMCDLMDEINQPGPKHSNYLKLPIISEDNLNAMKNNIKEVHEEGLPSFLELTKVEGLDHGIFLSKNAQQIVPGTALGEYVGELKVITKIQLSQRWYRSEYAFDLHGPFVLDKKEFDDLKKDGYIAYNVLYWKPDKEFWMTIDAQSQGNWTRFVNGADIAKNSNVAAELTEVKDGSKRYFTVVFKASRLIEPGQQLLIDYGPAYWKTMGRPPMVLTPDTYRLE